MSTRTITDLRTDDTLRLVPDAASVAELSCSTEYLPAGATSIALPVKTAGFVRYDYEVNGRQVGKLYLGPGSDASLADLLIIGGSIPDAFIAHIEELIEYALDGVSGGSVSGSVEITRSIVVTTGNYTAGSTAQKDYVYLVAGLHTTTLPTAVGNTNRYTIKNNHSADITVAAAGAQTIDGTATITIGSGSSVDLISDGANWSVI